MPLRSLCLCCCLSAPSRHSVLCSGPAGSEYDEEEVDFEESDSDESWTTESAISSEAILSSMCMNGGEEKPFACPVPGCKKRYKVKGLPFPLERLTRWGPHKAHRALAVTLIPGCLTGANGVPL